MSTYRKFGLALLAAAFVAFLPRSATAQQEITMDFAGSGVIPTGDLDVVAGTAPGFEIGANFRVHPMVSVRVAGGASLFPGTTIEADNSPTNQALPTPSVQITHLNVGPLVHLTGSDGAVFGQATPVAIDFNLGAGIGVITSERITYQNPPGQLREVDLSNSYLSGNAGLTIGYPVSETVELFARGQLYITASDAEELEDLSFMSSEGNGMSTLVEYPISGGVRLHFEP